MWRLLRAFYPPFRLRTASHSRSILALRNTLTPRNQESPHNWSRAGVPPQECVDYLPPLPLGGAQHLNRQKIKSKSNHVSRASRIGGTQINSGSRRGAPAGNRNAVKALEWLSSYDLSSPQGLDAFMQAVVKQVWTGELGTRAASSINGTLRLLLEHMTLPSLEKRLRVLEQEREVTRQ